MIVSLDRRRVTAGMVGLLAAPLAGCKSATTPTQEPNMFGLIGKMTAVEGKRDELSAILLAGLRGMPGNLSYIVAKDPTNIDVLWITEAWIDQEAHQNSLTLPSVQEAIKLGRPMIAGMERIAETQPIGGEGI